jgi:hypothetical protein
LQTQKRLAERKLAAESDLAAADIEVKSATAALKAKEVERREAEVRLNLAREQLAALGREPARSRSRGTRAEEAPPPLDEEPQIPDPRDRRLDELEKRLDRVIRELEERRGEPRPLRRERPGADPELEVEIETWPESREAWLALIRKLLASSLDLTLDEEGEIPTRELVRKLYEQILGREPTREEARRAADLIDKARDGDVTTGDAINALAQALASLREYQSSARAEADPLDFARQARRLLIEAREELLPRLPDEPANAIVRRLYQRLLDRAPTEAELERAAEYLRDAADGDDRIERFEDLAWSLLLGSEARGKVLKPREPDVEIDIQEHKNP